MRVLGILQAVTILLLSRLATPVSATCKHSTDELFTTTDGTTYAYEFTPAQGSNTTFLLLHGYPSSHKGWEHQIATLSAAGFGVLAPDMLGFGASDLPTDVSNYKAKRLSNHLTELLDHEELGSVIGVGHDWGANILSRLAAYHRDRFAKFAFINVGHRAPGGLVDIDAINAMLLAEYGYMPFGYWYFFDRYDASSVIGDHVSVSQSNFLIQHQTLRRDTMTYNPNYS